MPKDLSQLDFKKKKTANGISQGAISEIITMLLSGSRKSYYEMKFCYLSRNISLAELAKQFNCKHPPMSIKFIGSWSIFQLNSDVN